VARLLTRVTRLGPEGYAGAIYGTIVATAVIAGLSEDPDVSSWDMVAGTLGTTIVFWIAHVYARILGERAHRGARPTFEQVRLVSRTEWPMVESGVLIAAPSVLAALGLWSRDFGAELAVALGVAILFGIGLLFGRREGVGWPGALLAATVNGLLGAVIVVLKTLVH
jgi:hypothetical protein